MELEILSIIVKKYIKITHIHTKVCYITPDKDNNYRYKLNINKVNEDLEYVLKYVLKWLVFN